MLSKKKVSQMDNKELLLAFQWHEDKLVIECNSRRGITKKTSKDAALIIQELCRRLDIEYDENDWFR